MSAPPPHAPFRLGRLLRFARKELREVLRDRRTILTLVLMPLLLYPLLAIALRQLFVTSLAPPPPPEVHLAFDNEEDARLYQGVVVGYAHEAATREGRMVGGADKPAAGDPLIKLFVRDENSEELEELVRKGKVHLGLRARQLVRWWTPEARRHRQPQYEWELLVLDGSVESGDALRHVRRVFAEANLGWFERSGGPGGRPTPPPAVTRVASLTAPKRKSAGALPTLIPLILVLMTITGAVYPAIDVTAGERERGTLEVLMAAPVPRFGLLLAKYAAVLAVALLTALVNLGMMTATVQVSGLGPLLFGGGGLTAGLVLKVLGLLLLFALFFSAVLLAVTSFARSFKEAQAYLIPVMLAAIGPGIAALLPDLKLEGGLCVTPLINVVLLTRDLFEGTAQAAPAAVVVASTLLYAGLAVAVAARVFGAEAVLYNDRGGWSDLFRRPAEAQPAPTPGNALLCLALLFPALFLLVSGVYGWEEAPLAARLTLLAALMVPLFLGLPLVAAWLERVPLSRAFALRPGPWLAYPAAAVLGVSLWPFAAELLLLLHRFVRLELPPELQDRLRELLEAQRAMGLPHALLVTALVPAVVEELFFRGYLFTALRTALRPWTTVLLTALLFGLFHIVTGGLAWPRLLVTTLLGVVLGWVRLRTGSVLPGVLVHLLHNGLLTAAALASTGPLAEEADAAGHVPLPWLAAGLAGAALGALGVWASGRRGGASP
jgi:sodium transport system permease protein